MIKIDSKNSNYYKKLKLILDRRRQLDTKNYKKVSKIINDIKKQKKRALLKYEIKFSKNKRITLPKKIIDNSTKTLNKEIKNSIDFAFNRIMKFHLLQKKNLKNIFYKDKFKNKLEYKIVPIQSVGIYVPANLPSSLLMNAIPAKVSKVKKIILATPKLDSAVMYAAKKVGIKEVYFMGGAQAIASLAYIQNVDKIVGPGNKFVAEAKRQISGKIVGTESMFAGPSEICVVADKFTNINQIATSLVSQAEHDPNSQCILLTKHKKILSKVNKAIKKIIYSLPRKKIANQSLNNHGLMILLKNDREIIDTINLVAPEHLEINVKNYKKYINKIHNAGSICNGKYTPMSLSDYTVGTNHILPTSGSAKFSSGLSINEFIKKISIVTLSKLGVEKIGNQAIKLSEYEKLFAHTQSIKSRM